MARGLRYRVTFKITGEVDDSYIPQRGRTIITLYDDGNREEKVKVLLSDIFNISENRIVIKKIEFIGEI